MIRITRSIAIISLFLLLNSAPSNAQRTTRADSPSIAVKPDSEAIVIIDGIQQEGKQDEILNKIDVKEIVSMNVLKGEAALKKYGEKAKNGAIEIITKNNKVTGERDQILTLDQLKNVTPFDLLQVPKGTSIVGYSFTIDTNNGSIISIPNSGHVFSTNTKVQINNACDGCLLTIDNIRILENGKEKKLPSRIWYLASD